MGATDVFWAVSLALRDPEFVTRWRANLTPELLPKGPLRFLLAVALHHVDTAGQPVDQAALLTYLRDADEDEIGEVLDTYRDLASYAITESSRDRARQAAEEWLRDQTIGFALDKARAALASGDRDEALLTLLELHGLQAAQRQPPVSFEGGGLRGLLAQSPRPSDAIPTGLRELDEVFEGGFYPGNLAVVLAPTNVGKTFFLCFLAASAYLADARVLYFTFELTRRQIALRVLSGLFQRHQQWVLDLANPDEAVLALRQDRNLSRASLVIEDGLETVADLRRFLERDPVDLVLLDSADDMRPRQQYQNSYGHQGEIYSDLLLTICQPLEIPVVTSTQATRDAIDRARLSVKHTGDSIIKARRAHLMLGLSQSPEELANFGGPVMNVMVLKDSLHGSRGRWWQYTASFGRGSRGWPGFTLFNIREAMDD